MDKEIESSRKKRRRDHSYSSDRSRSSRSRSKSDRERDRDRKKAKKEKKKKESKAKSKNKEKKRRSKSRSSKKESKKKHSSRNRSRSKSRTRSSPSDDRVRQYSSIPPMDPMMQGYMPYYAQMMPRDPRMVRPPVFYPPAYSSESSFSRPIRPPMPMHTPMINPAMVKPATDSLLIDQPTDKIVKDQNFLNSDEKLFESIVNNEMSLRSIFEDVQISETYAGSSIFKAVKKILYEPQLEDKISSKLDDKVDSSTLIIPKPQEIVRSVIDDFLWRNSYEHKSPLNLGNMDAIREQLYNYRNRSTTEELNSS
jgi:hypothetical protein